MNFVELKAACFHDYGQVQCKCKQEMCLLIEARKSYFSTAESIIHTQRPYCAANFDFLVQTVVSKALSTLDKLQDVQENEDGGFRR